MFAKSPVRLFEGLLPGRRRPVATRISRGLEPTHRHNDVARIADAGAAIEMAVLRIEAEVPRWHLRSLEWDGENWRCTLSLYPSIRSEFDDAVESGDALLPRAIPDAISTARRQSNADDAASSPAAGPVTPHEAVWCDNFY